ncbi:sulfotransferase [Aquisalibacillus elongatus]|uniref:Sulfotransferase family protein n=1 Tax=Aquisalibacillus elongatus TaxID=485577 RepID=A0A3N5B561_9BACI|nr:sulfotransferase [Aquisalibacillus elongatus]RPF50700.1 sulfotransferase family protein [Aquisalibacillus elongatus]
MDLIILSATHRSGSTLLQRIFNARKETLIWGEQNGLLNHYQHLYKNLVFYTNTHQGQREKFFNRGEDPNVWIACMTPEKTYIDYAVTESLKVLFDHLYEQNREGHDIIGFKEVRYGEEEINLLRKCYPEAKLVLLVRTPVDVWKSMNGTGLAGNVHHFINKWNKHAAYYLKLANSDPNAYLVKYEDLVNQKQETLEMISEVGFLSIDDIQSVISKKISTTSKSINEQTARLITNKCAQVMRQYGYLRM